MAIAAGIRWLLEPTQPDEFGGLDVLGAVGYPEQSAVRGFGSKVIRFRYP